MLSLAILLLLVSGCAPLSIRRGHTQSPGCGRVEGNFLQSPGYPSLYPTNAHCVYAIPLENNKALKIKFLHFDIESSAGCSYDYVEVKDNEVSYGKYCGNTLQGDDMVIDDTPYVYIVFHSDKTLSKTGFRMEFEHVNKGHQYGGHEVETVTVANTEALPLIPTTPFHPITFQPNNVDFQTPSMPKATSGSSEEVYTLYPTTETNLGVVPTSNPFTNGETSKTTPDVFPTNEATPDIFPTNEATPDVFPTNEATPDVFPTNEATPDVFPTNEATPDVFPTNEATSDVFPTNEATPDVFPTNEATPDVFPTNKATPDVFPTNEATPDVFPTNEATPDVFRTNEATPDVFPTHEATPDVFPTHGATSDVFPTNEATSDVFPTNKQSQTASETVKMTKSNPTTEEHREEFVTKKENSIPDSSPDKRLMKPKISNDDSEEEPTNSKLNVSDVMMNASLTSVNESLPTGLPMGNESIVSGNVTGSEGPPTGGTESPELMSTLQPTDEPEPTNYKPEPKKHVLDKLKLMALLQRIKYATLKMEELLIGNIVEEEVHESRNTYEAKREMDDFRYGMDSFLGLGRRYKRKVQVQRDLGTEFMDEMRRIDQDRKKMKRSSQVTKLISHK